MRTNVLENKSMLVVTAIMLGFSVISMSISGVFAANSGAIWTTNGDCGGEARDVNQYQIGDVVYINGSGFDPQDNPYDWSIEGKPGGASADPGIVVASGSASVAGDVSFCFEAYTVQADDDGEYGVDFGGKGDNYRVEGITEPTTGTIVIQKNAVPDDAQNFSFTGELGVFDLDDDQDGTLLNSQSFTDLTADTYSITESATAGWTLSGVACTGETDSTWQTTQGGVDVTLVAGETVTCTFTNTQDVVDPGEGTIVIVKNAGNDTETEFSFTTDTTLGNFSLFGSDSNQTLEVPGTYSVSENVTTGWTPDSVVCVSSIQDEETSDSIELDESETVTCTFTNSQDRYSVRGTKYEWPTEDGLPGWTIFIDENANGLLDEGEDSTVTDQSGNYSFEVLFGEYSICEVQQQGYTQIVPADNGCHTVDFGDDESGVRNFHNDRSETPDRDVTRIIVRKVTNVETSDLFTFLADWTENFTLTGNSEEAFNLDPGTYSITEVDLPGGWLHESTVCTSDLGGQEPNDEIGLSEGETVTCVFTNDKPSDGGGGGGGGGGSRNPEPEVLGEQTEILPAAAPNTGVGAGGLDLMGSLSTLIGLVGLSFVNRKK
uniref:Peptidase S8 and S53 subtilisin kexin sedolisin n=2 Tax=Parcubacteria group TaxID=1794811 RepID=A0A0H4T4A1_9BACT|nr:peptidase S8 and S53 subtilisin kexin sedolisin [uncultured Parcubacteria bacterium Rifle_16ft_4_minimus_37647]